MRESEALECVAVLIASYPTAPELEDIAVVTLANLIGDLDFGECKLAIGRLARKAKWFPSAAEIRAEVAVAKRTIPGPEIAWGEVREAIGRYGQHRTPKFSCPEVATAVRVIGWKTICLDPQVMSTRARFVDAYRSIHEEATEAAQLGEYALPRRQVLPGHSGPARGIGEALKGAPARLMEPRHPDACGECEECLAGIQCRELPDDDQGAA